MKRTVVEIEFDWPDKTNIEPDLARMVEKLLGTDFSVREFPVEPERGQGEKSCDNCMEVSCDREYEKGYNPCEKWHGPFLRQPIPTPVESGTPEDLCSSCYSPNKPGCMGMGKCSGWFAMPPAKVDANDYKYIPEMRGDKQIGVIPVLRVDADLSQLFSDCAECLDDCLIRIYPEEFEQKYIAEAGERFAKHRGTIARIADLVERIKNYTQGNVDDKNLCAACGKHHDFDLRHDVASAMKKGIISEC
jgi:hypothetical protein